MIRIVCPSCQAAYNVPANAIAAGGRELQCSACGHNWYQLAQPVPEDLPPALTLSHETVDPAPEPPAENSAPLFDGLVSGAEEEDLPDSHAMFAAEAERRLARMRAVLRGSISDQSAAQKPQVEPSPKPTLDFRGIEMPSILAARARRQGHVPAAEDIPSSEQDDPSPMVPSKDEDPEAAPELPFPPRRPIHPDVLAILKEEAAVETQARRREAPAHQPLESQGELPLVPRPKRSAAEVRERLARLQTAERTGGAPKRWTPGSHDPLVPDEDEEEAPLIPPQRGFPPMPPMVEPGAQLRARAVPLVGESETDEAYPADAARRLPVHVTSRALSEIEVARARRGFRIGFALPIVAALLALALYLGAPAISEKVPAAAPALAQVVAHGDRVQSEIARGILALFGTPLDREES